MIGDITVDITIKAGSDSVTIPVIPPKITYALGDATPKTVSIWQLGDVDFNNGREMDDLSWSSFFPARYDASYCKDKPLTPTTYRDKLNKWKNNGTEVQVIIPAYSINRTMKIITFQGEYKGQEADFYYDIEFKEYRKLTQVKVEAKKYVTVKKRTPTSTKKPAKDTSKKNTKKKAAIKKGDKVQFNGGNVYISSDAKKATVKRKKAKCKCTIVNSNKHPYHLIAYSGDKVYGWCNAADCTKI